MITETKITESPKRRKSVLLTKEEHKALKDFRKSFITGVECAEAIEIDPSVLQRILLVGSGSPRNISKIKAILPNGTGI